MTQTFIANVRQALPYAIAKLSVALFVGLLLWSAVTLWDVDFSAIRCLQSLHTGRGWTFVLVPICLFYIFS